LLERDRQGDDRHPGGQRIQNRVEPAMQDRGGAFSQKLLLRPERSH